MSEDDDYAGFSNLESSQDVSMGFGVSGLTQRPADEDNDPYNFEINIKGGNDANSTPWMTEEERRAKNKPKKKVVKAGDTSAMSKANKWLKKAKKKKEKKSKKVETLENLSLSEDDMSSDSDGASSNIKRKKRSMQFKVPTAGKQRSDTGRGMTRSSALTNLGNVRGFDEEDSDDIDNNGINIAESFSKAKVSPKSNKLPGGLEAFMSSSQGADKLRKSNDRKGNEPSAKSSTSTFASTASKREVFGNVLSFGDIDNEYTSMPQTRSEALGKVVSFDQDTSAKLENATIKKTSPVSKPVKNKESLSSLASMSVRNEALGNVRGIEDLGMIDDDAVAEEVSMDESIGVEELIEDEQTVKPTSNTKRSIENSYRHNPTPPPLQSQHSNATDYSMEDFEQDGYSMDDFETSVQESSTIKSNAGNESTVAKTSRKPLSTLQNNENSDTANEYRGPSPRAKSARLRASPTNSSREKFTRKSSSTREIGIQASSGVDIGIQAEMVPLPPLGADPYMYHMGLGLPAFARDYPAGTINASQSNYVYPRFGNQQFWAQPRHAAQTQQQKPSVSQETPPGNNGVKSDSANVSVEDPPIDAFQPNTTGAAASYNMPPNIQSQISQSNDLFKRQLALIRQQIEKSRNRALQAQAAMHYKTYEIIKKQTGAL